MFSSAVTAQRHLLIMVGFVTETNSPSGNCRDQPLCSPNGSSLGPRIAGTSVCPGCGEERDASAAGQF
jgi:hypothetical protein